MAKNNIQILEGVRFQQMTKQQQWPFLVTLFIFPHNICCNFCVETNAHKSSRRSSLQQYYPNRQTLLGPCQPVFVDSRTIWQWLSITTQGVVRVVPRGFADIFLAKNSGTELIGGGGVFQWRFPRRMNSGSDVFLVSSSVTHMLDSLGGVQFEEKYILKRPWRISVCSEKWQSCISVYGVGGSVVDCCTD